MPTHHVAPTLSELRRVCTSIEPAEFTRLARGFLRLEREEQTSGVPLKEQIIITIWEFYSSLGLLTDGQRRVLFTQMDRVLNKIAEVLADCFDPDGSLQRALPILLVTLHDQRYATWTHYGELYDLDEERQIDELEEPAISMIACNVMAAYTRLHGRLRQLRKAHGPGRTSDQAAPPGPPGSAD